MVYKSVDIQILQLSFLNIWYMKMMEEEENGYIMVVLSYTELWSVNTANDVLRRFSCIRKERMIKRKTKKKYLQSFR